MQRSFAYDYRGAENLANTRLLHRALYSGRVRWTSSVLVLLPSLIVFGLALVGMRSGWFGDYALAVLITAAAFAFLSVRVVAGWVNRRAYTRITGVAANEGREVTCEFRDDGYVFRTEFFELLQRWPGVDRMIVAPTGVMFVVGAHAHTVPARAFADAASRDAFIAWARERLTPEARARSTQGALVGWRAPAA